MFSRLVSLYRPYMLGIRTLLQNALLPALTGTPSPQSTAQLLDSLASSSPYGVQHMYKSLDAAVVVLLMAREMDPRLSSSNDSARAFYSQLAELQQYIFIMGRAKSSAQHNFGNKQVIVLEGFGQSGKSLLLRALVARFGHTAGCALDEVWPDMRAIFAGMPEAVSCAFDFVKCYFLARRISEVEDGQTVFVENYYHSSCARTACLDQSRDPRSLPEVAFYWPTDLPQPNLVLFLALPLEQLEGRWTAAGLSAMSEDRVKFLEIAYSFVAGPPIAAIDANLCADQLVRLVQEIMVYHCGIHLSSRPIGHECSSSITEMCVAVQEESSAVVMDEEIVMDDVFDDESSAHTSNARAALSRAHSSHKKMNSRRSSLGVFGAFSELKMDW